MAGYCCWDKIVPQSWDIFHPEVVTDITFTPKGKLS